MDKRSRIKSRWIRFLIAAVTLLALLNLCVLCLWPSLPARLLGKEGMDLTETSEEAGVGSGEAALTVAETARRFSGEGLFDPLAGVQALDVDGTDITDKVAVAYVSGKTIDSKVIRYTVYDEAGERLEAVCDLILENYEGPSLTVGEITSISWEDLQNLTDVLIEQGVLSAEDGFGHDVSAAIAYAYTFRGDGATANITFSISNQFQDYTTERITVPVEDMPEE